MNSDEKEKLYLSRLEELWKESRDEIKQRITQRDNYFIRMSISFGIILAGSLKYEAVVFIMPIVALYFTILTVHSYQIHVALSEYMRDELEIKIQQFLFPGTGAINKPYLEYEQMSSDKSLVGVRSWLCKWLPYFVSIIAIVIAFILDSTEIDKIIILSSCAICSSFWLIYRTVNSLEK